MKQTLLRDLSKQTKLLIVITVMLVTIIEILDMTIVNVALPPMMGELGANSDQITWVLTSYIVSSAIIMPLTGFLVTRIGRKKLLLINIGGFLTASMLCGLATTLPFLVLMRIFQGIFGATLVPMSQYILRDTFQQKDQGTAMAIWGLGVMVAPVIGPTLGGYITQTLSWHWVFYINIPVCLAAFLLTLAVIPDTPTKKEKIDITGLVLMVIGIIALQMFLDRGNSAGWYSSKSIQVLTATAIFFIATFIVRGLLIKDNIVNLRLFGNRNFLLGTLMFTLFSIGIIGIISVQPLMLEHLMNYTAENAGLVMAPRGIAAGISMFVAGMLVNRIDTRWLILAGIIIADIGTYEMSVVNLQASFSVIAWQGAIQGFGMGLFFVPIAMIALSTLKDKHIAEASGLFGFGRNLGVSIGISIISTIITQETQINWNRLGGHLKQTSYQLQRWLQMQHITLDNPIAHQKLAIQLAQQASLTAFVDAYWVISISFLVMIPLVFLLKKADLAGGAHTGVH
jgi:MFS transporter, DHA2 family, multidrug resistance protein